MGVSSKVTSMKAVFLDRDGVINKAIVRSGIPYPPYTLSDFKILPSVKEALTNLKSKGYKLIVISNQPDVARGSLKKTTVEKFNSILLASLPIDEIMCCYHDDSDNCNCRKPKPGFIFSSAKKYKIDLSRSFMIGDRWRDIDAGKAAGCITIFIDYDYNEKQPNCQDYSATSLLEASKIIEKISEKF